MISRRRVSSAGWGFEGEFGHVGAMEEGLRRLGRHDGQVLKAKTAKDRATSMAWGVLGLPSKHDLERTLHALNQIQSRLLDLEERLDEKKNKG